MRRTSSEIVAEFLPVLLVMALLGGSWLAIVALYRHAPITSETTEPGRPATTPPTTRDTIAVVRDHDEEPDENAPEMPVETRPDPTIEILANVSKQREAERQATETAARRASALTEARSRIVARTGTLQRRQLIVDGQLAALKTHGRRLEVQVDALARLRDVLVEERDDLGQQLAQARSRDGYAVLPYKGPNGTWRRPIPIECANGTATIQPDGPSFSLMDLSLGFGRATPLAAVVQRYCLHLSEGESPDGAPVVPYLLFIVRPDGIRPYYEARSQIEPLGIAFGYELVEQDEEIEFPDLDDLAEWSEMAPLRSPFAQGTPTLEDFLPSDHAGSNTDTTSPVWKRSEEPLTSTGSRDGTGSESEWKASRGLAFNPAPSRPPVLGGHVPNGSAENVLGNPRPPGRGPIALSDRNSSLSAGGSESNAQNTGTRPGLTNANQGNRGRLDEGQPSGFHGMAAESARSRNEGGVPATAGLTAPNRATGSGNLLAGTSIPREAPWPPVSRSLTARGSGLESAPRVPERGPTGALRPEASRTGSGEAPSQPGLAAGHQNRNANGTSRSVSDHPALGAPRSNSIVGSGAEDNALLGGPGGRGGSGLAGFRNVPEPVLDLVVVCRADGALIQPGGYRLKTAKLEDGEVVSTLRGIVQHRQKLRPDVRYRPRIKFLVEPGGTAAYWEARRQTALAGLGWPIWLEVAEGSAPTRLLDPEILR